MKLITNVDNRWVLSAMLLLLHAALWWEFAEALSRSLMLAHLGLFLIWQPFWNRAQKLDWKTSALFMLLAVGFTYWLNWWFIFFWLILLAGLVGGIPAFDVRERIANMLTLLFLVSDLLIGCMVPLFSIRPPSLEIQAAFKYGLLFVPVVIGLIDIGKNAERSLIAVDLFRGTTVALLTAMLAAGSLINMYRSGIDYTESLVQVLIALAAFLLVLSWLISPRAGFRELTQLWERSLLNIGTPFERWLSSLALLARQIEQPQDFLQAAFKTLVSLPWLDGAEWTIDQAAGLHGVRSAHHVDVAVSNLNVRLYSSRPLGASFFLHCNLLVNLLAHFYTAKQRERELAERAHLQAIYETGSRITHDIKNLLQSLYTMASALEPDSGTGDKSDPERRAKAYALLDRQLPLVIQRLKLALDKLQTPGRAQSALTPVDVWWASATARHTASHIHFSAQLVEPVDAIPIDLVDSVLDNLLENANLKHQVDATVRVCVTLEAGPQSFVLEVCDSGYEIPADRAAKLLTQALPSASGLGIGLYQAAKQAEIMGYALSLEHNEPGRVCFRLASQPQS